MDQQLFWVTTFFIFGSIFGSFANVCIARLPYEKSLGGRSKCPKCKTKILWQHNIPIFSYLYLKGICFFCRSKISKQYIIIELVSALGFATIFYFYQFQVITFLFLIIFFLFLMIFVIDMKLFIIPNELNYLLIVTGFVKSILFNVNVKLFPPPISSVAGLIVGYLIIWMIIKIYFIWRKKEGMGYGDAKLLSGIGAWFGIKSIFFILFYASFIALLFVIPFLITHKKKMTSKIPFGPFLVLGTFLYILLFPWMDLSLWIP